jgi:tripartite ATP-independent transporter DctM subunit
MAGAFVGHLRGGLGYVAIFAGILLASLSGSAVADTAALAAILVPMMRQAGYEPTRACGLMAAGGIIAPVIPPSIGFLIFGVVANLSITRLFLAGIAPGIMMGLVLIAAWWLIARRQQVAVAPRVPWGRRLRILGRGGWALMLPVIIIGGLRSGIFTPTESAVVAAAYALFVGLVVYRELDGARIYECLLSTARTTAVVLVLAALAMVASYMITITDISGQVGAWLQGLSEHPLVLMSAMMVVVFFAGMVLDFIPIVLIFTPVFMPIVLAADIDPVYFGVVFIMNCSIGMITPPVGVVLNVISSVGKITMTEAARGILPFLAALMALLVLLILFPALVTVPAQWWR